MGTDAVPWLEQKAREIRRSILQTAYECGRVAHPGPALSCADLCTAIYYRFLRFSPEDPLWSERDRFILSKGHACLAQYAILADLGFFPKSALKTLRHTGSILQGHPTYGKTPGVDMTTGSLGNGLGIGLGMAYYAKLFDTGSRVYVVLGDGELNEGTVWESANIAPVLKVGNLTAIVDCNGYQSCGATADILPMWHLKERWEAFGWRVLTIDGHNMSQIVTALQTAASSANTPVCILAKTVKGKGVSFMEGNNDWHQKALTTREYNLAMQELAGAEG